MFQPLIPTTGLSGWRFLQETYDSQFDIFTKSIELKRDTEYFSENIGKVTSAEELVSDRRMLTVALGAFGLQDDINNRYFIRKILEEGTVNDDAIANRFSDKRYQEMSQAFGFGPSEFLKVNEPAFVETIVARFQANSFEVAAGTQDESMRIALYAQRELAEVASMEGSTDTKWFTIMADPPLRKLFEKALNLPESIGQIDIDQQLGIFKDRASKVFGTDDLSQFTEEAGLDSVIEKYLLRNQIDSIGSGMTSGTIALTLLQT